jgi:hypothetical protein
MQVIGIKPEMVIPQELVKQWIMTGDKVWSNTMEYPDEDPDQRLLVAFQECLIRDNTRRQ